MLIGGFYNVDLELLQKEPKTQTFSLRLDVHQKYKNKIFTNNGRTATIHIFEQYTCLQENEIILLPDYLCLSVITSLEHPKISYEFYKVHRNLDIDIEDLKSKITKNVKGIYVIHYFGFPQKKEIVEELKNIAQEKGLFLIEDITQTLFSRDEKCMGFGDYIVGSTRKWMPMTDGGILAIRNNHEYHDAVLGNPYNEATYKQLLISLFRDYYKENPEKDKAFYLQLEQEANKSRYVDLTVREMTSLSQRIFFGCNQEELMEKRRSNYTYLYEGLRNNKSITILRGALDSEADYIPFGFVILVEKREEVYEYLVKHHIIPEIQWILPLEYYNPGEDARYLSDHNLMIQCDQRYGKKEMNYIITVLNNYTMIK